MLPPASVAAMNPNLPWRLGLGWLVGRKVALLTTVDASGSPTHTVIPYLFSGGVFFAPAEERFLADLASHPEATIQAGPGHKGVVGRRITEADLIGEAEAIAAVHDVNGAHDWVMFEPTGRIAPTMTAPDLVWVWMVAVVAALAWNRWGRRIIARRA